VKELSKSQKFRYAIQKGRKLDDKDKVQRPRPKPIEDIPLRKVLEDMENNRDD